MKFLIDAQLPRCLSRALNDRGHDALHTPDLPCGNRTADSEINDRSVDEQRIVVPKDSDFVESLRIPDRPCQRLYVAAGNITNRQLQHLFDNNIGDIECAFSSHRLIELTSSSLIIHN